MFVKYNDKIIELHNVSFKNLENLDKITNKLIKISLYTPLFYIRKELTNFHSVSYLIPPFTTITGLIFSMLGIKRENFDNFLESNSILLGVEVNNSFDSIKYSLKQFRNHESFENQLSIKKAFYNNKRDFIYNVYLFIDNNTLYKKISNKEIEHIPYLGSSSFLLKLEIEEINIEQVNEIKKLSKKVVYSSELIKLLDMENLDKREILLDLVPLKRKEKSPVELKKEVFVLF